MASEHHTSERITYTGYHDPEHHWFHTPKEKDTNMKIKLTAAQKVLVARYVRHAVATVAALAAVWVVGPDVLGAVDDPMIKSLIIIVVAPALVTLNKQWRMAKAPDADDPK